jgi:hypothetical protein
LTLTGKFPTAMHLAAEGQRRPGKSGLGTHAVHPRFRKAALGNPGQNTHRLKFSASSAAIRFAINVYFPYENAY